MQHLMISQDTVLSDLVDLVGFRNVDSLLAANQLTRSPDIGAQRDAQIRGLLNNYSPLSISRKLNLLNSVAQDSDVFESLSLLSEAGWAVFDRLGSFPDTLCIPDSFRLPDSSRIIGDSVPITKRVHDRVINDISEYNYVDPSVYTHPSTIPSARSGLAPIDDIVIGGGSLFESFAIPWGKVTLYSSIADNSVNFPVYPEELDDERTANYTQMPDLLYQYEPWQLYQSSGPRQHTYSFNIHRDMWSGDHRDGHANYLIRFCQAQCYPEFNGSAVHVPISTLYVDGNILMRGVMLSAKVHWDGPIGLDHWYLHFTLDITMVEVSKEVLNFNSVLSKPLIG